MSFNQFCQKEPLSPFLEIWTCKDTALHVHILCRLHILVFSFFPKDTCSLKLNHRLFTIMGVLHNCQTADLMFFPQWCLPFRTHFLSFRIERVDKANLVSVVLFWVWVVSSVHNRIVDSSHLYFLWLVLFYFLTTVMPCTSKTYFKYLEKSSKSSQSINTIFMKQNIRYKICLYTDCTSSLSNNTHVFLHLFP